MPAATRRVCVRLGRIELARGIHSPCAAAWKLLLQWGLLQIRLHFSLRGDAKCVRGPSESSASRLARADALDRTSSTASKRKEVMAVLFRASAAGQ